MKKTELYSKWKNKAFILYKHSIIIIKFNFFWFIATDTCKVTPIYCCFSRFSSMALPGLAVVVFKCSRCSRCCCFPGFSRFPGFQVSRFPGFLCLSDVWSVGKHVCACCTPGKLC